MIISLYRVGIFSYTSRLECAQKEDLEMITQELASFVIDTSAENLPANVVPHARDALIDTLGVSLAGTLEPVGEIALRWAHDVGAKPQATILGTRLATSAAEAAF